MLSHEISSFAFNSAVFAFVVGSYSNYSVCGFSGNVLTAAVAGVKCGALELTYKGKFLLSV